MYHSVIKFWFQAIQAEQHVFLDGGAIEVFAGGRAFELLGKANAQIGLFDEIKQARHRPALRQFRLQAGEIGWFGLRLRWSESNPAVVFGYLHQLVLFGRQAVVERLQGLVQLRLLCSDEGFGILRELERRLVRCALIAEILWDITVGIAMFPRPFDPDFLTPNALPQKL